jgi:hypothetical protein
MIAEKKKSGNVFKIAKGNVGGRSGSSVSA